MLVECSEGDRVCRGSAVRRPCVPDLDAGRARLDLAGRWTGAAAVLHRSGPVRGRPAPRRRHRGRSSGSVVVAPAAGTVSFVGFVPGSGHAVTITTDDGYAVTLLQLAATSVARGDTVTEGAEVGVVGESSDAVTLQPHVHLGVRVAADPNGYVDPLGLLPARPPAPPTPPPVVEPPVRRSGSSRHRRDPIAAAHARGARRRRAGRGDVRPRPGTPRRLAASAPRPSDRRRHDAACAERR